MAKDENKHSVVVILGATGVGKSRLSIDLASRFSGEVINADSMQVYRGLDILTNKVPVEERRDIPHHLLGAFEPTEECTVKQYRDLAIVIIDDILQRGKLPIIVGGTNYYIQALVSSYLLDDFLMECPMEEAAPENFLCQEIKEDTPINLKKSPEACGKEGVLGVKEYPNSCDKEGSLYECLKQIDEQAASGIHPNNFRKLNQYINMYKRTGRKPSEVMDPNKLDKWGTAESFRYNCCFICLDAELEEVDKFVNDRVDVMMQAGLLDEISEFYAPDAKFTRGLHQAIGVREFSSLFSKIASELEDQSMPMLGVELKTLITNAKDERYSDMVLDAVMRMKANTRRLVRIQKRRFNRLETQFGWHLHRIDLTDVLRNSKSSLNETWSIQVLDPSLSLVEQFLKMPSDNTKQQRENLSVDKTEAHKQFTCEVCNDRIFIGMHQWQEHVKSRNHRKRLGKRTALKVKKI